MPALCPAAAAVDLVRACADRKTHLQWAAHIARLIGRVRGLRGQERDDLVAVAHLTLVRLARTFEAHRVPAGGDPDMQFRGWAHPHVRSEVEREAIRLRNAGTYWTRRETGAVRVRVGELPVGDGGDVIVPAREEVSAAEAAPPVAITSGARRAVTARTRRPKVVPDAGPWRDYLRGRAARG